jgi:hypothetical protein
MPTYTESELVAALNELLKRHELIWEEFISLGEAEALAELDPDLDFAYRNLVPHLAENPPIPA